MTVKPVEPFDVPLFIDGKETPAVSGRTMDIVNPATGCTIGALAAAGEADVNRAVAALTD